MVFRLSSCQEALMRTLRAADFLAIITCLSSLVAARNSGALAQSNGRATNEVPLDTIYYTHEQKPLKFIAPDVDEKDFHKQLKNLSSRASSLGASNVFLVRGERISTAVQATWSVFAWHVAVDEPVLYPQAKSEQVWLAVYLGVGPSSTWKILSVNV